MSKKQPVPDRILPWLIILPISSYTDPVFDKRCKAINDTDDHGDTGIEGFWLQVIFYINLNFFLPDFSLKSNLFSKKGYG